MIIEQAEVRIVHQPWGSRNLRPWSTLQESGEAIGELRFDRGEARAADGGLVLELLFTTEPLPIQVHPDDALARSIGLEHGRTKAWYVLSAAPGAMVAVGLQHRLTFCQIRASIEDGSIAERMAWIPVAEGDVVLVPAGTVHALGSGLIVAEIHSGSDATFRLFDHGSQRELHVYNAAAATRAAPIDGRCDPVVVTADRTLLAACPQFVLECIDLDPGTSWDLSAERETWILVLDGCGRVGRTETAVGRAIFVDRDSTTITTGAAGLKGLVAYAGGELAPSLLRSTDDRARLPSARRQQPRT